MNIGVLKKSLIEAIGVSVFLILLIVGAGADSFLPAPSYNELDSFNGTLVAINIMDNKSHWKLRADNSSGHRVFYIPRELCSDLNNDLKLGDVIESRLYRRFGLFGSIRAWEIKKNLVTILPYSTEGQKSMSSVIWITSLAFIGFLFSFTLMFYNQYKNKGRT